MNNNPEPSGLRDSELREDRKTFSLIGLACLAAFGLELAVNLLVSYFFFRGKKPMPLFPCICNARSILPGH